MNDGKARTRAAFRLNLEQQKKQAKELLKAARAGNPAASQRIDRVLAKGADHAPVDELKLADAQFIVARELGFPSWAELKMHVLSMERARRGLGRSTAPDAELPTLHLRCGSDIRPTLLEAGFRGDFLEHSYPYAHGPITTSPDHFEREARFIVALVGDGANLKHSDALKRRQEEERALSESADEYERIVLWMEHDCFDQLVLTRCLAHYATSRRPPVLELISVRHFPGSIRFIGLGQLPPEAMALLWKQRKPVSDEQLELALKTWTALASADPRPLAALMRANTPALPDLAPALHRLLRELPAVDQGVGLTESLILHHLSAAETSLDRLFAALTYELDPLPFATDLMLLYLIERMRNVTEPLVTLTTSHPPWQNVISITDMGRKVLRGESDFMLQRPITRWVGGVETTGERVWRWDERSCDVRLA